MRKLGLSALILSFTFVSGCGGPQKFFTKANELAAKGATAEAILNYKKALQKDPNFGEAHYRLGLLELNENRIAEAYQELRAAVMYSPENLDAKAKLADMCLKMYVTDPRHPKGLYDQVAQLSEALIQKDAKSYDALRLKGYLAVLDRSPQQAAEYFKRAQATKPLDRETTTALAQSLNEAGAAEESEQLLRKAIAADKRYGAFYDILYLQLVAQKRVDTAEQVLKDKIAVNPKEPVYALELATHYLNAGREADANAMIAGLLQRESEFPNARLLVGEFYVRHGKLDEALEQFRVGMKAHPADAVTYQKRIASVFLNQGKRSEGAAAVEEILKAKPDDEEALLTRANLWIDSRDTPRIRSALKDLEELSKKKVAGVHLAMGRALLILGEPDRAKAELIAASQEAESSTAAHMLLSDLEARTGHGKAALEHADAVIARQPGNRQARLQRVRAMMSMGNQSEAGVELANYRSDYPGDLDGELQYGLLLIASKRYAEAESQFRKFYRPGQADLRPLEGLVDIYIASGKPEQGITLLEQELKQSNGGSARIRSALATMAAASGHDDVAIKQFEEMLAANPNSPELLLQLAKLYKRNGKEREAADRVVRASQIAPENARTQAILGQNLEDAGRRNEAIARYRKSLELNPQDPVVMNNLAMLLADDPKQLDEALRLASAARQKAPSQPAIADTVGWIYYKKDMFDSALQIFGNLTQRYPENGNFRYHHGATLLAKGDKTKAKQELQAALARNLSQGERQAVTELLKKI